MIGRARPLLGTLVTIQMPACASSLHSGQAMEEAFAVMARIGTAMSAHDPRSDLGRLSRATPGQTLTLDAHTLTVLQAAQHWCRLSGGAFHPVRAACALARQGRRPGLHAPAQTPAWLEAVQILSATEVRMAAPVLIDLGGIAKGYAVDQAIAVLQRHGITDAIVNAGGDLRVLGQRGFAVDIRHAGDGLRVRRWRLGRRLREGAMATSVADPAETGFVATAGGRRQAWRSATVLAADCMSADALTKWALQSSLLCPSLRAAMRQHRATLWRS